MSDFTHTESIIPPPTVLCLKARELAAAGDSEALADLAIEAGDLCPHAFPKLLVGGLEIRLRDRELLPYLILWGEGCLHKFRCDIYWVGRSDLWFSRR